GAEGWAAGDGPRPRGRGGQAPGDPRHPPRSSRVDPGRYPLDAEGQPWSDAGSPPGTGQGPCQVGPTTNPYHASQREVPADGGLRRGPNEARKPQGPTGAGSRQSRRGRQQRPPQYQHQRTTDVPLTAG